MALPDNVFLCLELLSLSAGMGGVCVCVVCSLQVFVQAVESPFFERVFHSWGLSKFWLSWWRAISFLLKESHFLGSSLSVEEAHLDHCRSQMGMCSLIWSFLCPFCSLINHLQLH